METHLGGITASGISTPALQLYRPESSGMELLIVRLREATKSPSSIVMLESNWSREVEFTIGVSSMNSASSGMGHASVREHCSSIAVSSTISPAVPVRVRAGTTVKNEVRLNFTHQIFLYYSKLSSVILDLVTLACIAHAAPVIVAHIQIIMLSLEFPGHHSLVM